MTVIQGVKKNIEGISLQRGGNRKNVRKACKRKHELNLKGWVGIHHVDGWRAFYLEWPEAQSSGEYENAMAVHCDGPYSKKQSFIDKVVITIKSSALRESGVYPNCKQWIINRWHRLHFMCFQASKLISFQNRNQKSRSTICNKAIR